MTAEALGISDLTSIRSLLEANSLPIEDLEQSNISFFGTRDGRGLSGVVGLELLGAVGLLRSLAVREDQRGSGLGTNLLRDAEAMAAAHGITELFLLTTTAEPFFASRGYSRRSREGAPLSVRGTIEFRSICPSSAACMGKLLPSALSNRRNQ